jgi:AraC-like DNA-binding protein
MSLIQRFAGHVPADVRGGFIDRSLLWLDGDVAISDASWERRRHPAGRVAFSDFPSVVFIREGIYIKTVGSSRAVGDPTQVTLYDGKLEVGISHPRGDRVLGTTFVLTPELLGRMFREAGIDPGNDPVRPFRRLSAPVSSQAHLLYLGLVRYLAEDPAPDETLAEETIHRLLGLVLLGVPGQRPPSRREHLRVRRRILDVQSDVGANSHRKVRLRDVAATLGCSPEYASRVFAQTAGMPLSQYVVRVRLRRAADRILQGESDLAALALEVGFASHSHFTAAFSREFGAPPSVVRKSPARELMVRAIRAA